jgi:hypothetical protein
MYKNLSICFGFGFLGAVICTWVTPGVISILFTPPVSFGTNCEPAATWATEKLIRSQIAGVVLGVAVSGIWLISQKLKKSNKKDVLEAK